MNIKRFAAAALALYLCGCTAITPEIDDSENEPVHIITASETPAETTAVTTVQTEPETEPAPVIKRVTFTATGDNLIHSSLYKQAARRAAADESFEGEYDFRLAYENAADLLCDADITVMNQETLICGEGYELSSYPMFNSPTELGEYMAELGVDVFTIANNHMLDQGSQGLSDCLDYYSEHGYTCVGAYKNEADKNNIRTVEANGVTVAFLAYTESLNGLVLPSSSELCVGRIADEADYLQAIDDIKRAEEIADITVVSLHWGVENSEDISDYQRTLAKRFADAGAEVIIGNHPHVLRDIELIDREDGSQTLCAYSLGNFISAQNIGKNLIGGTLDFTAEVSEEKNIPVKICEVKFTPVITHYDGNYSSVRLYKLSDYTEQLAANHGVKAFSTFGYDYVYEYLEKHGLDKWTGE